VPRRRTPSRWSTTTDRYSPRPLCTDFRLNEQTAHVLGELEYERVAFTHGTEITDGAREAVRGFLTEVAGA
jgi:hypothetical protein